MTRTTGEDPTKVKYVVCENITAMFIRQNSLKRLLFTVFQGQCQEKVLSLEVFIRIFVDIYKKYFYFHSKVPEICRIFSVSVILFHNKACRFLKCPKLRILRTCTLSTRTLSTLTLSTRTLNTRTLSTRTLSNRTLSTRTLSTRTLRTLS